MLPLSHATLGQLAVAHNDSALSALHRSNPFYNRSSLAADELEQLVFGVDATEQTPPPGCARAAPHELRLAWTTKLGASIYSTPLLVPSSAAGGRAVWANTFVRYAEAIGGVDGHELPGWPYAFARSAFHTSPLAYDVDGDGIDEMLLVSFDAEVIFLSPGGLPLRGRGFKLPKLKVKKDWFVGLHDMHTTPFKRSSHGLVGHEADDATDGDPTDDVDGGAPGAADASAFGGDVGAHGGLSAEAEASFGLFAADEGDDDAELFEEDGDDGASAGSDEPRLLHWAERFEDETALRALDAQGYVYVDAHALSTPALADVDGDGAVELVLALSYFFEDDAIARLARHGIIVDKGQYVAGGVLAIDPGSGEVKWAVHLDLTTEHTKLRAYVYSPVTVADLDGDGAMEVVIGTSMGFLYALDGRSGALRDGFPVQMNEIQAQVTGTAYAPACADMQPHACPCDLSCPPSIHRHLLLRCHPGRLLRRTCAGRRGGRRRRWRTRADRSGLGRLGGGVARRRHPGVGGTDFRPLRPGSHAHAESRRRRSAGGRANGGGSHPLARGAYWSRGGAFPAAHRRSHPLGGASHQPRAPRRR